jgi:DNA-binding response OmpR family regulator
MAVTGAHRVLIVEDDASILSAYTQFLEEEGYAVTAAVDGRVALQTIVALQPLAARVCVVLLDLRLPGIPGLAVLKYLRDTAPSVPVVVMTAQYADLPAALAAGAASALEKPFGLDTLLATVSRYCPRQEA